MANNPPQLLIIEDDDLIVQMYQASLANSGFVIRWEKDGESGMNALRTTTPDIILLDIMLPKINGLDILSQLRADARLAKTPVIVMSSLMDPIDQQKALSLGATAYWIKKDVNMLQFPAQLRSFLAPGV